LVMPAVKLADSGFLIDQTLASSLNGIVGGSRDFPELQRVLGKPASKSPSGGRRAAGVRSNSAEWEAGDRLVQPDLARTLRLIAEHGPDAFYKGPIAGLIVAEMRPDHACITSEDLAGYRAYVRDPIDGTYRGFDLCGPPPPSPRRTVLVE